jgi:hypothetical protein
VAVRNGGIREKRIQTIHGELRLKRSVLKVKHEGGEERKRMKEAVSHPAFSGATPALRRLIAFDVAMPMSNTVPWAVKAPWSYHFMKFRAISSGAKPRERESARHRESEVSSDQVPGGWL